jgi:hypothetical protein
METLAILEKIRCFKTIIMNSSSAFLFSKKLSISSKCIHFTQKMLRLFIGWLSIIIVWQLDMISTIKKSKNTFTLAIIIWFDRPVLSYSKRQSRTGQVCSHMICIFIFLIMPVQAPFHVLYIGLINVFLFRLCRISLHTQSC